MTDDPEVGNGGAAPDKKLEEVARFENEGGMTTAGPAPDPVETEREQTPEEKEWQYQVGVGPKPGSPDPALPAATPQARNPADTAALSLDNGALKINASLVSREGIDWLIKLVEQTRDELFDSMPGVEVPMMAEPKLSSTELLGGKRPGAAKAAAEDAYRPSGASPDLGDPGVGRSEEEIVKAALSESN